MAEQREGWSCHHLRGDGWSHLGGDQEFMPGHAESEMCTSYLNVDIE